MSSTAKQTSFWSNLPETRKDKGRWKSFNPELSGNLRHCPSWLPPDGTKTFTFGKQSFRISSFLHRTNGAVRESISLFNRKANVTRSAPRSGMMIGRESNSIFFSPKGSTRRLISFFISPSFNRSLALVNDKQAWVLLTSVASTTSQQKSDV